MRRERKLGTRCEMMDLTCACEVCGLGGWQRAVGDPLCLAVRPMILHGWSGSWRDPEASWDVSCYPRLVSVRSYDREKPPPVKREKADYHPSARLGTGLVLVREA